MNKLVTWTIAGTAFVLFASSVGKTQIGRLPGQEWVAGRADAQQTSWIRSNYYISRDVVQKPGFELQWKVALENQSRGLAALARGVTVTAVGLFKPLSYVVGSSNTIVAIDNDTGIPYWRRSFPGSLPATASLDCPGGTTGAATRMASRAPVIPALGRGALPVRAAFMSGVGEPGEGVPAHLMTNGVMGPGSTQPPARGAPPPPARAGGAPAGAPPAFGGPPPVPSGPPTQAVYFVSSDGVLHRLGQGSGKDLVKPFSFVPANARVLDLIAVDNIVYATTANNCGGVADGVWAVDITDPSNTVVSWKTSGGSPVGPPAFGGDGTLYVAIGSGTVSGSGYANAVVSLDPKTLVIKDWFTQPGAEFAGAPTIFAYRERELVAAIARDGRIFLLNAGSLGGADHRVPVHVSSPYSPATGFVPNGLATWEESDGTRWLLAPTAAGVTASKVSDRNGALSIEPGWTSREMRSPVAPVVTNGVVFALATGEFHPPIGATTNVADRVRRSVPAVLYAIDGTTGKELWNSGKTITSFVHGHGPWVSVGQVHVADHDNVVYAFGPAMERR